jgi:hypothetical protein
MSVAIVSITYENKPLAAAVASVMVVVSSGGAVVSSQSLPPSASSFSFDLPPGDYEVTVTALDTNGDLVTDPIGTAFPAATATFTVPAAVTGDVPVSVTVSMA